MSNYSELTLISNDSFSQLHTSNNSPSNFRNYFNHDLEYDDLGECAIKKITFHNYFHNINISNNIVFVSLYPSYTMKKGKRIYGHKDGVDITEDTVVHPGLRKFSLPLTHCHGSQELFNLIHSAGSEQIPWWSHTSRGMTRTGRVFATRASTLYKTGYELPKNVKMYLHSDIL